MINFRIAGATLRAARLGAGALLAAASLATSAQAAVVVYDSLSGGQRYYSQCFACSDAPSVVELGDIVTLAGTERRLQTISLALEQDITTTLVTPYQLSLTLGLYSFDANLVTSLIASRTVALDVSASGTYTVPIDFRGVDVPDTFYYGLSATSASSELASFRMSLWDYYAQGDPYFGDGPPVPVGTDVGTVVQGPDDIITAVYVRLDSDLTRLYRVDAAGWSADLATGLTPMIQMTATSVPVPEPQSLALVLTAGVAMVLVGRRKRQER